MLLNISEQVTLKTCREYKIFYTSLKFPLLFTFYFLIKFVINFRWCIPSNFLPLQVLVSLLLILIFGAFPLSLKTVPAVISSPFVWILESVARAIASHLFLKTMERQQVESEGDSGELSCVSEYGTYKKVS